ncbi:MAG: ABC transporter substrate-binding protein [Myxococcales bacterium]|jgi:ABC-type transporter MlaC component
MALRHLLAAALLLAPLAARSAEPDVAAQTNALVAAFKKAKPDDGKLSKADREANAKAFAELDALLDGEYFTSVSIQPRADKFSPEQLTRFKSMFWQVVQLVAYPNSGAFFREAKLTFEKPTQKGEVWAAPIKAFLPAEDLETVIELHWRKGDKGLKVVDVLFDGDSLVRDYQNQFSRIVDKSGADGLLKALEEKRAELSVNRDKK